MAVLTQTIWDVQGITGRFWGEATYDDTSGKIDRVIGHDEDSVPHSVIVTYKGNEFATELAPASTATYTPPANVRWGRDQFDIRTV